MQWKLDLSILLRLSGTIAPGQAGGTTVTIAGVGLGGDRTDSKRVALCGALAVGGRGAFILKRGHAASAALAPTCLRWNRELLGAIIEPRGPPTRCTGACL